MRGNSSLWMAALIGGGLLLAALAGLVAVAAMGTRNAENALRKRAEADEARRVAEEKDKLAAEQAAKASTPSTQKTPANTTQPQPKPSSEPTPVDLWQKAAYREYATTLREAFDANAIAAENKFKGKTIGVVGSIVKIDTDPMGRGVVVLAAGEFAELGAEIIMCTVDGIDRNRLGDLSAGNWIALIGECKGKKLTAVIFDKCRYLHATRTEAEMKKFLGG